MAARLGNNAHIDEYTHRTRRRASPHITSFNKSYQPKKRSSPKKPFFANRAYTILGHGNNGRGKFVVPYNSLIIVKAISDDLIGRLDQTLYLQRMMDMDMDVLLNPLENMNALIENFGSVHVYYPGDLCPNFNYQLLNNIPFLTSPLIRTTYPGSGIVDIAKMKDSINPYLIHLHTKH